METISAPPVPPEPVASPADTVAEASAIPTEKAQDATGEGVTGVVPERAAVVKVKEPPMTGREFLEYVVMFIAGVIIVVVTLWFYWLIQ